MLEYKTESVADSVAAESPTRSLVDLDAFVSKSINAMSGRRLIAFERRAQAIMKDAEARANTPDVVRGKTWAR